MGNFVSRLFNPENDFFKLTQNSKRLTHISLSSFVMPIIFLIIAGILTQFVFAPILIGNIREAASWIREIFMLLVLFGLVIILIFLWIRFFEGRLIYTLGFTKKKALSNYLNGFFFGIFLNSIVVGIMAIFGSIEVAQNSNNVIGLDAIGIVLLFLLGFLIQGASEEILSRGWMMQVIGARYKPWLGVLISTLFFALVHLGNSGINIPSVLNLLLVAILLSLFVIKDGSLWFACAWHSSWNWIMGNVYGLSVSGSGEKVSIFDLNTKGNELISGAGFGPEGSIITTIVLVISIIITSIIVLKKQKAAAINND